MLKRIKVLSVSEPAASAGRERKAWQVCRWGLTIVQVLAVVGAVLVLGATALMVPLLAFEPVTGRYVILPVALRALPYVACAAAVACAVEIIMDWASVALERRWARLAARA